MISWSQRGNNVGCAVYQISCCSNYLQLSAVHLAALKKPNRLRLLLYKEKKNSLKVIRNGVAASC